jgi:transposase
MYSLDFRRKVLEVREKEKLSLSKVSKRFGIGLNTVMRWSKSANVKKRWNRPAIKISTDALKEDIEHYPDAYQHERAARLDVSKSGIYHALKRINVSYKKKSSPSQSRSRKAISLLPKDSRV